MADTNGLIPIKELVLDLLFKEKKDEADYLRYYQIFVDAIIDMHLYNYSVPVIVKLVPNLNNIIDLPKDYVEFKSIGIPINGELWSFTQDSKMNLSTTEVNGNEIYDEDFGEGKEINQGITSAYGAVGGHNENLYTIDEKKRRITLNGIDRTEVILVYTSSGVSLDVETLIPVKCKSLLQTYVRWQISIYDDMSFNQVAMREKYYKEERGKFRGLGWTLDQFRDAMYSVYTQVYQR